MWMKAENKNWLVNFHGKSRWVNVPPSKTVQNSWFQPNCTPFCFWIIFQEDWISCHLLAAHQSEEEFHKTVWKHFELKSCQNIITRNDQSPRNAMKAPEFVRCFRFANIPQWEMFCHFLRMRAQSIERKKVPGPWLCSSYARRIRRGWSWSWRWKVCVVCASCIRWEKKYRNFFFGLKQDNFSIFCLHFILYTK